MLKNAYLLAKIGADTAENYRNVAESLPKKQVAPKRTRGPAGSVRCFPPRAAMRSSQSSAARGPSTPGGSPGCWKAAMTGS